MELTLGHFLFVSSMLFALGAAAILSHKNTVAILMGVELVLNAAAINFAAFDRFLGGAFHGQVFSIFIILIAAAEAAVALAIVLRLYQNKRTINMDQIHELRH